MKGGDPRAEQARLVRVIGAEHRAAHTRLRQELGFEDPGRRGYVPAMQALGDPAERALRELLAAQVTLEGFEERARHVLAVAEHEARTGDPPSLRWFGASLWSPGSFGRAVAMAVGEDRRPAKPAEREGPTAHALRRVRELQALEAEEERQARRGDGAAAVEAIGASIERTGHDTGDVDPAAGPAMRAPDDDDSGELIALAVGTAPAPQPRWITPLGDFLGDEEPSDDDSADWIIRDVIPRGEAALLAGPPKCGKTWSMLSLGLDIAMGKPWLDTFENTMGGPVRVLLLAFEDSERRLRKRVWELSRARGISPNDPMLREHLSISRNPLRLPGDERAFAEELKAWKPALVLTDNLTRVMIGDQNAIKDAKRFCDTWTKLCSDVGASIGFLHHTSKVGPVPMNERGTGDPFELVRGSGDFVAAARHVVLIRPMESPDDGALADVRMRGNLDLQREDFVLSFARSQDPHTGRKVARLAYRGDGDEVRGQLAADRKASKEASKRAEHAAAMEHRKDVARGIARKSSTRSCSSAQLGEALDLSDRAVMPVLEALEASGEMTRVKQLGFVLVQEPEQGDLDIEPASGVLHHGGV